MPIDFVCDDCPQKYRVPDSAAGKTLTCKRCGKELMVPALESSEAMPWTAMPTTDDTIEVEALLQPTKSRDPNSKARKPARESSRSTTAARQVPSERQDLGAGVYLEGFEDGWRLVASAQNAGAIFGGMLTLGVLGLLALVAGGELWFFILPMTLLAVPLFIRACLRSLTGRIEISVKGDRGTVFNGVGASGPVQQFSWSASVKITEEVWKSRNGQWHEIVLSGPHPVRTGKHLTPAQASVMLQTLIRLRPYAEDGAEAWLAEHLGNE